VFFLYQDIQQRAARIQEHNSSLSPTSATDNCSSGEAGYCRLLSQSFVLCFYGSLFCRSRLHGKFSIVILPLWFPNQKTYNCIFVNSAKIVAVAKIKNLCFFYRKELIRNN